MNRFIHDSDYPTLIRDEIRTVLLENYTDQKLLLAEKMGVSQVKHHLAKYDVATIFKTYETLPDPDPRDHYMVMISIDCALYHLYSSLAPDSVPNHRSERYQDALNWLQSVHKGEMKADLPIKKDESGHIQSDIKIGSKHKPCNYRW